MALCTIGRRMASCQWECSHVVVKVYRFATGRMAGKTCCAIIDVSIDSIMILVGFIAGVTRDTGKYGIVSRRGMAVNTLIPFSLMLPAINREILIVMIEGGRHPC